MVRAGLVFALIMGSSAGAHEHMYIGSDRPHGGSLVLRYDFARKFPLVPAPDGNGFIGTDPAFNAQIRPIATLRAEAGILKVNAFLCSSCKILAAGRSGQRGERICKSSRTM